MVIRDCGAVTLLVVLTYLLGVKHTRSLGQPQQGLVLHLGVSQELPEPFAMRRRHLVSLAKRQDSGRPTVTKHNDNFKQHRSSVIDI